MSNDIQEKKTTLQQLDEYVTTVFDKNGDGRIDFKEIMASIQV